MTPEEINERAADKRRICELTGALQAVRKIAVESGTPLSLKSVKLIDGILAGRASRCAHETAACQMREQLKDALALAQECALDTTGTPTYEFFNQKADHYRVALAASSPCAHKEEVKRLRALCGEAKRMIQDHVRDCDEVDLQYRLLLAAEGREA